MTLEDTYKFMRVLKADVNVTLDNLSWRTILVLECQQPDACTVQASTSVEEINGLRRSKAEVNARFVQQKSSTAQPLTNVSV